MDNSATHSQSLAPYIPRTILEWYGNSDTSEAHVISCHTGSVVCIDASGFTALTRNLSSMGKEGPEILTKVLNLFFEAVSNVVFRYDGDVLKFAGDALWAYFPEQPVSGEFFADILDAVKSVNASSYLAGRGELRVHVGAEFGEFHLTSLGHRDIRLEAEPLGNLLGTVYATCDIAKDNEFAVGPALARRVAGTEDLTPIDVTFSLVGPKHARRHKHRDKARPRETLPLQNERILRSYIPQDVLTKIETSAPSMSVQGEHRQVVVLFASFECNIGRKTDDLADAVNVLNSKLLSGFQLIRRLHGNIARIDPFKRGHKLLVLFGAPVKRESDEINAIQCARELLKLNDSDFRIRVGLALGPLFCGDVGAEQRREYTVMGDGINLAARLMAKAAWNEILIDPVLRNHLPMEVATEPVALSLKGISDEVICHRFVGIAERAGSQRESVTVVGQRRESVLLKSAWDKTLEGCRQLFIVSASTGVGKSTLVNNLLTHCGETSGLKLECKNSQLFASGWLAHRLMQELLRRHPVYAVQEVSEFLKRNIEERWLPLFADIIQTEISENEWTRGLTPELRKEKTGDIFAELIRQLVDSPRLVILDDFYSADEVFKGLIAALVSGVDDIPLMLVIVTRDKDSLGMPPEALNAMEELTVSAPSNEEWWEYFHEHFQDGKREEELFERILSASGGNPHFITQFLSQCLAEATLIKNAVSGKWELAASGLQIAVPDGLMNLHLSVFDALPEMERTIMKAASVAVGDFSVALIKRGLPEMEEDAIGACLNKLADDGLLEHRNSSGRYAIVHTSMREAIYQTIPASQQRLLHRRFAEMVEKKQSSEHTALLAYHFYRAGEAEKGFRYSLEAARRAFERYALTESAELFNQCLSILHSCELGVIKTVERISFYNHYVKLLNLEGRYGEMYRILREWRRVGKESGRLGDCATAAVETADLLRKQTQYHRSRKLLNSVLSRMKSALDNCVYVRALLTLSQLERRSGEFGRAQELSVQAVEIAERAEIVSLVAMAYTNLGLACWGGGKLDEAAKAFRTVIGTLDVNKRDLAINLNNLAITEQECGRFRESERLLGQAVEITKAVGDKRNEANCSGNLANLMRISGRLNDADKLFLYVDAIFERLGDRHAHFYIVGNLGDMDLMRGEMTSAEERFHLVADFAKEVDDKELVAECEVRFGELAFFAKDIPAAEAGYRNAIRIAEEIGSTEYVTRACVGLARLLIGERNHEEAIKVIERISELATANHAILPENEAIFLMGEHYRIQGEFENAAQCYRKVLSYAREQNLFELILKLAVRLYETEPSSKEEAAEILRDLRDYFIEHNSAPAWDQLMNSAYFSYFAETLKEVVGSGQPCASAVVAG